MKFEHIKELKTEKQLFDSKQCLNSKVYLLLFSTLGILQNAYFTYFVGILSTLEKRFKFSSSITGIIIIADNISPAIFSIFVGYWGRRAHRPHLLFGGMIVTVTSCFLCCVPLFLHAENIDYFYDKYDVENVSICRNTYTNISKSCNIFKRNESYFAIVTFFLANFLNGCGSTVYYTIGTSYLDDNVNKKESPLYLGLFFSIRMIGPTLGFMMSSFSLKKFENPFIDPGFSENDPQWIGCWWLGFVILGISLALIAIPLVLFPKEMSKQIPRKETSQINLFASLKKLVSNPILVFHALGIIFQINGIYGYLVFMPKYMQDQFKQTASSASFFSGTTKLCTLIAGVLLSSSMIHKLKPSPRWLTGYMVMVAVISAIGLHCSLFLGCSSSHIFQPANMHSNSIQDCRHDCECNENMFTPICVNDSSLFYSPCHAGCSELIIYNQTKVFKNCSCIEQHYEVSVSIKQGFCPIKCNSFLPYFVIMTVVTVLVTTTRVGKVLLTLRCCKEDEKSLTLGAVEFLISVLATIPFPLIYGHVIDGACHIWGQNCDHRGNCILYNSDKYRSNLHTLSIVFVCLGILCECVVFYLSKNLKNFYGKKQIHQQDAEDENEMPLTFLS